MYTIHEYYDIATLTTYIGLPIHIRTYNICNYIGIYIHKNIYKVKMVHYFHYYCIYGQD